ncbi:MAG TPA: hypothetical protein VMV90_13085 [Rectinemataceae bacterium]|nr:hypothetical protein [Rectinemataceae bacterium]
MIGFFFKKTFFDGWDNLFTLVLQNVVFVALAAIGLLFPAVIHAPAPISAAAALLAVAAGAIWWSACVYALKEVADFHSVKVTDIPAALRSSIGPGLQLGAILSVLWLLVSIGLPFYLSHGGLAGALAAGVLFWFGLTALLSLQYYLPLRSRLGGGFVKNIRKSFVLFFDNPLFSVFLALYNAVSLALSGFLAFLIPGLAGIALALDEAVRLRLYKYDWLERNPGARRRAVPWDELVAEDSELVGKRTLKGMIFPWKE